MRFLTTLHLFSTLILLSPRLDASCGPIPEMRIFSADEASGSKYRKVSLLGRPMPDEKPQAKEETDYIKEETYVDAMTNQLTHTTTDIYIPVPGSDLALEVRRSVVPDSFSEFERYEGIGIKPNQFPDRAFDICWRAQSLTPYLLNTGGPGMTVLDESGGTYEFRQILILNTTGQGTNPYRTVYWPSLNSSSGKEAIGSSLRKLDNGSFVLRKRYGTELTYMASPVIFTGNGEIDYYYRLAEIKDRYGNRLVYEYSVTNSLIPSSITVKYPNATTGASLTISQSNGRVMAIEDAVGNEVGYDYNSDGFLSKVTKTPQLGVSSATEYEYAVNNRVDSFNTLGLGDLLTSHWNIEKIKDANGNAYTFEWDYPVSTTQWLEGDPQFQYPAPFVLKKVNHPNGKEVTFEQENEGWPLPQIPVEVGSGGPVHVSRSSKIVDAEGNALMYVFDQPEQWDEDGAGGFYRAGTLFNYKRMTLHYYKGSNVAVTYDSENLPILTPGAGTSHLGQEEFTYKVAANLSPEKVVDFSGNETTWEYADTWSHWLYFRGPFPNDTNVTYTTLFYEDPTKETNDLGKDKLFEYEPTFRLLKKVTDRAGQVTEYTIDEIGRRTREEIKNSSAELIQDTVFDYSDTTFTGFMTKKTVKKLAAAGDPSWVDDLVTQYVPDSQGRVFQEIVDPDGLALTTEYSYDANNNKLSAKDPNGNETFFAYDGMNRLVKVTYPIVAPATTASYKEFFYDLRGNKTKEVDENGNATLFAYNSMNQLVTQARDMNGNGTIDSGDLKTEFTYDGLGSKLTSKDPNGNITSMEYDALQRLVKTTAPTPLSYETAFEYGTNSGGSAFDVSGFKPTKSTDARGFETKVTYDVLYRPTKKEIEYADGVFAVTDMAYDDVGNMTSQKVYKDAGDTVGITTEFEYDDLNRQILVRNVAGNFLEETETESKFTSTGLKYRSVDELDRETDMEYDLAGRPTKVYGPALVIGGVSVRPLTETVYDAASNVIGTINPLSKRWDFTFDERNRKTKEEQPEVFDTVSAANARPTILTEYDPAGRVTKVIDARGNATETEYDTANRVTKVKAPAVPIPGGGTARPETVSTYDSNGNVLTLTDANSHITTNTYDALNRLATSTDAEGIVVSNEYDSAGNRTAVIDGKLQRTEFTYDGLNRNLTIKDPANKSQTFTYNSLYKIKRTDPMGQETDYSYDGHGRLILVDYDSSNTAINSDRTYVYDLVGNLLSVTEPGKGTVADVAYVYDNLNRVTAESSGGITHAYAYDLAGNRLSTVYGGTSRTIVSTYDALNRLATMTEGLAATAYAYDLNGNITKLTLPNADLTAKTYDALNRVAVIETKTAGTILLSTYTQTYDRLGNVVKVEEDYASGGLTDRTIVNTYDDINRLTQEDITSGSSTVTTLYEFDYAHNRTRKTTASVVTDYTYNNLNQLTATTGGLVSSYTYNDNGNRLTCATGGHADTYYYDFESRLAYLERAYDYHDEYFEYGYDYRTRRVYNYDFNISNGGTGTWAKVVFSGGTSVQEYTVGSTTTLGVEYIRGSDYGGGVGGILYTLRGGVPSYTHYNNRGDVVAKTSATGSLTYEASYEAYGKRTAETGSTLDRQKANTKDEDPTGLLNEGFRYRDLETGTFITRDPLGFVDGPNMYAYVVQNPWTKFDPEGLREKEIPTVSPFADRQGTVQQFKNLGQGALDVAALPSQIYSAVVDKYAQIAPHLSNPGSVDYKQAADSAKSLNQKVENAVDIGGKEGPMHMIGQTGALAVLGEAAALSKGGAAVEIAPSAKQTIQQSAAQGAAAEELVAGQLAAEGKNVVGRHVAVNTSQGRRVLDNLVDNGNGNLVNVEVKSGNATRNSSQVAKDTAMAVEGGIPVGKNAPANLRGQTVKIQTEVRQVKKEDIK